MSDENRNEKKSGDYKVPPHRYILWIAAIGLLPLLLVFRSNSVGDPGSLTQSQFMRLVDQNLIKEGIITYDPQSPFLQEIKGKYYKTDADGNKVYDNGKAVG